jgi:hypothetical protein
MQAEVHDQLELPTAAPMGSRTDWEEAPDMQRAYNPVVQRIQFLVEKGLMSMMVLHDFLSKRITPLQNHARPTWLYTGENDAMWLEHSCGSNLDLGMLEAMLSKLSTTPSSSDFINPPVPCRPICLDQAARSLLLKVMPMLDDIDIATRQRGDQSRGVHIPGMVVATDWRSANTAMSSGKGKEKIAPSGSASKVGSRSPSINVEALSKEINPLQRKRRLFPSDGSTVGGPRY